MRRTDAIDVGDVDATGFDLGDERVAVAVGGGELGVESCGDRQPPGLAGRVGGALTGDDVLERHVVAGHEPVKPSVSRSSVVSTSADRGGGTPSTSRRSS